MFNLDTSNARVVHGLVWNFREAYEEYWATPTPQDCMSYAFCEVGEAIDARLRVTRPQDSRNTDRDPTEAEELADVLIMLVSALGPDWSDWEHPEHELHRLAHYTIENAAFWAGLLLIRSRNDSPVSDLIFFGETWQRGVSLMVVDVAYYCRMALGRDVVKDVMARLVRIQKKHVEPHLEQGYGTT